MTPRSLTLAATAATLALFAGSAQAFTLNILHFNDFHSRIESINAFDSTCSAEDEGAGKCFGGAARLFTAVNGLRDELKARGEAVAVLDAGDNFQGSLFFTTYSGATEAEMLDRIGLDAMVIGNHEFDLGPAPLADFIDAVDFPVMTGNADVSADNRLAPDALKHVVLDFGGEKVGIIGVVTPDTAEISTPGPTVTFLDPVPFVTGEIAALKAEGVERIVVLSHLGAPADIALAGQVGGIDAIVGGHSHTLFSNTDEKAPYKYPLMVDGPDGAVPIVSAGSYSKDLGHLALTWDDAGRVTAATGDTMLLDASVTPDPGILKRIDELAAPIETLKAKIVAHVPADIDGSRETCRAEECAMGDLVADAILARVKDQGVTIALQNGGGLRASIGAGEVSMGDVLAVLPFQNTLATFNIPGSAIVAALENGVSQVEEQAGRFPQVAGLRFTWDPKIAPGEERITSVEVREGDAWVPIDPAKVYLAATNNFMRAGGDGYVSLRDEATNAYDYGPGLEAVLADYLAANPDYVPGTDGRITRAE